LGYAAVIILIFLSIEPFSHSVTAGKNACCTISQRKREAANRYERPKVAGHSQLPYLFMPKHRNAAYPSSKIQRRKQDASRSTAFDFLDPYLTLGF